MLAPRRSTTSTQVLVVSPGGRHQRPDDLATEEPLEIRVAGPGQDPVAVAVTMRTPGHDFELAAGWLHSEGVVAPGAIRRVGYCDDGPHRFNRVLVAVRDPVDPSSLPARAVVQSSCGLCGAEQLDGIESRCPPVDDAVTVARDVIAALPHRLRQAQRTFDRTGALHATGLFDTDGALAVCREDVGRHNAFDKVVGHELLAGRWPPRAPIAMVSGRVSFEIVQKAALARLPVLCAVSAPSSLAVDAARRLGVTLVGFVRGDRCNVYSHAERVAG